VRPGGVGNGRPGEGSTAGAGAGGPLVCDDLGADGRQFDDRVPGWLQVVGPGLRLAVKRLVLV
jgi:hypothetical protein